MSYSIKVCSVTAFLFFFFEGGREGFVVAPIQQRVS